MENKTIFANLLSFLESSLKKVSQPAVILEAAKGILNIDSAPIKEKTNAIRSLNDLLTSVKVTSKFSALKVLDKHARTLIEPISDICLNNIESIIEDKSTNMSIKAISIGIFMKLSKILNEEKLKGLIKTFINQYSLFEEEFKVEVIEVSLEASKKNENQQRIYFDFFNKLLKLESSISTKAKVVESINWFICNNDAFKKEGLLGLAELIEDFSHEGAKIKIIETLGKEGANMPNPSVYVRFLYNRIVLDQPNVRVSALNALTNLALLSNELKDGIKQLIKRSLRDNDLEVRERAAFFLRQIETRQEQKERQPINARSLLVLLKEKKSEIVNSTDLISLMKELVSSELPKLEVEVKSEKPKKRLITQTEEVKKEPKDQEDLKKIKFCKGVPHKVTKFTRLTDKYAEYVVTARKIVYEEKVVVDLSIKNTLEYIVNL